MDIKQARRPVDQSILTAAQRQVVELLAIGLADASIARRLNVGRRTIARRVDQIYRALGVSSRFQAGIVAAQLGIVGINLARPTPTGRAATRAGDWRASGQWNSGPGQAAEG